MSEFTLADLEHIVARRAQASPDESWTAKLVNAGQAKAVRPRGIGAQVFDGPLPDSWVSRGQVGQIRRVGEVGADAGLGDQAAELLHLLVGMAWLLPALRRGQEDLHAFGAQCLRTGDAGRQTAGR